MGGGGSVGSRPLPKCVCAVLCHELCLFLSLLVRWEQIALCGHATVGAAHALASEGFIPRCQVGVSTGSVCLFSRRSVDRARLTSSARVGHSPQALKVRRVRWLSMPYLLAIPVLIVLSQANGSRWTFQLRLWRRFLMLK